MSYGPRIVSCFLIAGGLLGIIASFLIGIQFAGRHELRVISAVFPAVLFAWGILSGIDLWRGKPRGFRWAKILFALQIPVFSVARFSYEFSTFFSFRVMVGNTSHYFGGNLGSSSNIYVSPQSVGFMFGINIVAVVALCYLFGASRSAFTGGFGPGRAAPSA